MKKRYTPLQGQYLAFIHSYTKLHGVPPSEADLQQFFCVTPPSVHDMIVRLHKAGLIARTPGEGRSLRVRLSESEIPDLEPNPRDRVGQRSSARHLTNILSTKPGGDHRLLGSKPHASASQGIPIDSSRKRQPQAPAVINWQTIDWDTVDDFALAILYFGRHEEYRTWKGLDWEIMNRLHEKGYISDPVGKAKSVLFTDEGLARSAALVREFFIEG